MKWAYFVVVVCVMVADQIYARPGPNEFTHSSPTNLTEANTEVPDVPMVFTKENESLLRRTLDTNIGTIESKTRSDEISLDTPPNSNDSTVHTGTLIVNEKRHLGVAVPVTMEEIEKEMASQSSVRETSTSKDGISTWILLSATNPTSPPEMSRSGTESKVDKTAKTRDNSKAPNKAILKNTQNNKNKMKPKTTTPLPLDVKESNVNMEKLETLPEPMALHETPVLKAKKKLTTTVATSTPRTQLDDDEVTYLIEDDTIITTTKETPVPFLVLEPKDADFDLPQDRSPDSDAMLGATSIVEEDNPNELKKRTQFVVGSVLPESVMDFNDDRNKMVVMPEHGPRRRRSLPTTESNQKSAVIDISPLEELLENLKKRVEATEKNEKIAKEMKHIDYELNRLKRVIAEIKDIEQFQDELRIKVKNEMLSDTISNGILHIKGDITFVNELLDNPNEIDSKIANREAMLRTVKGEKPVKAQKKADNMTTDTFQPTEASTGLMGLLKILELKAAFGVNVLRSIRPAFDRAFADVFHTAEQQAT
ncbi:hypothetical protein Bhyg_15940, partial [Pseudolycoriella hygida]